MKYYVGMEFPIAEQAISKMLILLMNHIKFNLSATHVKKETLT